MNTLTDVTDEPLPLAYGPPDADTEIMAEMVQLIKNSGLVEQVEYATAMRDGFVVPLIGIPKSAEPSKGDFMSDEQPLCDAGQILPTPQETFDKVYAEVMATMPVEEPEESPLSSPSPEEKMARIESGSVPRRIRRKLNREMGLNGDRGDALRVQKSKWDNALEELKDGKILFIETSESECWVIRNLASRRGLKVAKRDGKVYLRENAPKMIRRKG